MTALVSDQHVDMCWTVTVIVVIMPLQKLYLVFNEFVFTMIFSIFYKRYSYLTITMYDGFLNHKTFKTLQICKIFRVWHGSMFREIEIFVKKQFVIHLPLVAYQLYAFLLLLFFWVNKKINICSEQMNSIFLNNLRWLIKWSW